METEDLHAELDEENNVYAISFDKNKVQVPQILSAVMEVSEVTDIKLQETELAEIVKKIYHHGSADIMDTKEEMQTKNGGEPYGEVF